jgi:hypothetical protein
VAIVAIPKTRWHAICSRFELKHTCIGEIMATTSCPICCLEIPANASCEYFRTHPHKVEKRRLALSVDAYAEFAEAETRFSAEDLADVVGRDDVAWPGLNFDVY